MNGINPLLPLDPLQPRVGNERAGGLKSKFLAVAVTPFRPPSAPAQSRLQGPTAKSNFLAVGL